MDNLDEFLKGDSEAAPEVEATAETPETETAQPEVEAPVEPEAKAEGQPRGPDGKFLPKGEKEEAGSPPVEETPSTIPESALIGERRRRQEAEDRLRALEQQFQQMQQPPQYQAPQGAPDMFEDPDGYTRYIAAQAAEVARAEAYQAFQYQRISTAATQYRQSVPDYEEKIQVFGQMAQANPNLIAELNRAANPAEYAYNVAKTQLEINQYGGLEKLIEARVQDALKAPRAETPAPPVPDTLADAQSARGSSAGAFAPKPLEDILGKAFRPA